MTTAVIVQARMGSTRFPGKVMADLNGRPVLAHVLERVKLIRHVDQVCCALPQNADSVAAGVAAGATGADVLYAIADEDDVLHRYFIAALTYRADVIVRITADCPMLDPEICGQVIALRAAERAEYASNVHPRSYPQGLDCEVFTFDALARAHQQATDPADREHVTPFMVRHAKRVNLPSGRFDLADLRWTLDYPEDLEFMRAVFAVKEPRRMADVLEVLRAHPEFEAINACRRAA